MTFDASQGIVGVVIILELQDINLYLLVVNQYSEAPTNNQNDAASAGVMAKMYIESYRIQRPCVPKTYTNSKRITLGGTVLSQSSSLLYFWRGIVC